MDDNAVSTVQTALASTRWLSTPCPPEYFPALARDVLYALEKARMAVVVLPEPDDPSTYDFGKSCTAAWLIAENDDGDTLDVAVFDERIEVDIPMDENRFDAECAQELACAILAAVAASREEQ